MKMQGDAAMLDFSAAEFRRRVAEEARRGEVYEYCDQRLNPEIFRLIQRESLRDAAVLIAAVDREGEAGIILTKRNAALRSHSGQVAFPGGRVDATDASAEAAALREAEEEIGLSRGFVDVIGRMPDYVTGTGYRIAPILAVVEPGFRLTINPDEVDDAFEVPLSFLMDPANHAQRSRIWQEKERFYYEMPFGERHIWGVTAGIIRTLYERLYG